MSQAQTKSNRTAIHRFLLDDGADRNARLRPLLVDLSRRTPDRGTNKASGESYFANKWLSPNGLHLAPHPDVRSLAGAIAGHANEIPSGTADPEHRLRVGTMWSIVSRRGLRGKPHRHTGRMSAAYYVDAGDSGEAGGLFVACTKGGEVIEAVRPESGMLLLFPSFLWHAVTRYDSDAPRIVVSANLF